MEKRVVYCYDRAQGKTGFTAAVQFGDSVKSITPKERTLSKEGFVTGKINVAGLLVSPTQRECPEGATYPPICRAKSCTTRRFQGVLQAGRQLGFWQIKLSKESALLTTFITPFGRFCFNRLPFGITSAPEYFQRCMSSILSGLEGVVCMVDDILVSGSTQEQHDNIWRTS